jgi:ATP-dependent DNA helicase RecG
MDLLYKPLDQLLRLKAHSLNALKRLDINTVRDLLLHIPSSYGINHICNEEDNSVVINQKVIIKVTILEMSIGRGKSPTKVYCRSLKGDILLVFFNKIPLFIFSNLKSGRNILVQGILECKNSMLQITHPEFILDNSQIKEIEPIYPLTYGITSKQLNSYVVNIYNLLNAISIDDQQILEVLNLLKQLHFPANKKDLEINIPEALKSLKTYEAIANQAGVFILRMKLNQGLGRQFSGLSKDFLNDILSKLQFTLTEDQSKALSEILHDQSQAKNMIRILQGDVGSGKTLLALISILNAILNGSQAVLLAPTDLLSKQHFAFFKRALDSYNFSISLLTGNTKTKERNVIYKNLEEGNVSILIGTHAVFQPKVCFKDLGYIVIDEQHRFGVNQRLELINKANNPDILVMTATPIPRTLSLTLFGDIDTSKLKIKPSNRLPIITKILAKNKIPEITSSIQKKLDLREKVYWVCPLIEESEIKDASVKLMNVTMRYENLNNLYPNQVGLLHGKMSSDQKDEVMYRFKIGDINILVATTVIEVGIDIADATLIVIENAERFGLAQLHQIRGRVGRSDLQSHALLVYDPTQTSSIGLERLKTLQNSNDGFEIAEKDLLLRGSGELLGIKQSGDQSFRFLDLNIYEDRSILLNYNEKFSHLMLPELLKYQNICNFFSANNNTQNLN